MKYKNIKVTRKHYDKAFELIKCKAYELYDKQYDYSWGSGLCLLDTILSCFALNEPCSMFYIKEMEKVEELYSKSKENNVSTL